MAYFLFKQWKERLFYLNKNDVIHVRSDLALEFVPICSDNTYLVKALRDPKYRSQFEYQLSLGDFGLYAFYNGAPIGYGWVKHSGSDDYFFKIGDDSRYLCRFFVHETKRGHNVYPELICKLIDREASCNHFYIDVERGNTASEKGLLKVGFIFVKEYGFIRGFKHTFNKKYLKGGVK